MNLFEIKFCAYSTFKEKNENHIDAYSKIY